MAIKKSDLYSSLWASCDALRGGMDASQYKDYVLFMLFIKYVSDKYADSDDFAPAVVIPKGASFKDMIELKGKPDIGDKINTQIIQPLIDANSKLARSDFPDFNDPNKLGEGKEMVERLGNLIAIFQKPELDFSQNRADHDDILGDAYEFLMRHFAQDSGKSKGQFYTPSEVSRILAKVLGVGPDNTSAKTTAYDPTCGSGSLLLKVAAEAGKQITLEGQEKDVTTAGLARMNMILHDFPTANVLSGNTLTSPKFKDGEQLRTYDYVVANLRTYQLLRYGVPVQVAAGAAHETVHLIDWVNPDGNDFGLAEEVTLKGGHERRPDIVLYINGIAVVVLELKRGSVEVAEGIRQLITNQEAIFNQSFFSTVQLTLAGNDSQGLRYGTAGTPEKFYVEWRHHHAGEVVAGSLLDEPLAQLCDKVRLLDLMRNFVVFDAGQKKVPRLHQYEGVKAAQERIKKREGGVIWHTQGSGKSILMVLIAKWLLEHDPEARVLVVTDRDELDKQIEGVMKNSGVIGAASPSPRITSRRELVDMLAQPAPRLLCALIHKFDAADLKGDPPTVNGRFYVFVDECHRTQGGDMNKQMKRWLSSPKQIEQFIHYFCGHAIDPEALSTTEPLRISFYKSVSTFVRAYADLAQNLAEAGYSPADAQALQKEADFYAEVREAIKMHSGEEFDIKPYEADMRHLINT
jgi:SWI2/SNF2 ATPase/N-6 DNA Methylase/Type I restriction enzyme R protein N terminus (HSDR_N)/HsdM N-terminal domain